MSTSATPEIFPSPHLPRRLALPDFPWDSLRPYRERAAEHPDGVVDLAVGTPVDPTPEIARNALSAAANAPATRRRSVPPWYVPPSSSGWSAAGAWAA